MEGKELKNLEEEVVFQKSIIVLQQATKVDYRHTVQRPRKNWRCTPIRALCYCQPETIDHLLTECNFSEATWDKVAEALHPAIQPFQQGEVLDWIRALNRTGSKHNYSLQVHPAIQAFQHCILQLVEHLERKE
jgi:hypothetical protein